MPINASPEYIKAEKEYLNAQTLEEKIEKLKKMISVAPKHKGSENLLAQLKSRLKRLSEQYEKSQKISKYSGQKTGIKKEGLQVAIVGFTNSGKSTLLNKLTNATPKISETEFTTLKPEVGISKIDSIPVQLIEIPPFNSEYYDKGIVNTADIILILVKNLDEIKIIESNLKAPGKKIILFNKIDFLSDEEKRKISSTLQSKKYDFVIISAKYGDGLEELKNKIIQNSNRIRIYTKEPSKPKSIEPIIMEKGALVKEIAEKIFKGLSKKIKETKITGPSAKFPNQKVGLKHELKDLDIVEFKIK